MVYKKSTKRTCITCTAKGVSKDKVPLWSKKDGIYSMLPKILNCSDQYNPNKTELKEETPEIVGQELTFSLKVEESDRWVFYWAAEPGSSLEGDVPDEPAESYGDESNRGLVKTDSQGDATITLNCPKLYKEDDTVYPRHVHYTVLTEDNVWSTTIGTYEIHCKVDYEFMKQVISKKTYLILNALNKEQYDDKHLPTSILCDPTSLEGLSKQKKTGILTRLFKENLGDLPKLKRTMTKTGDIKQLPIIVYCANSKCKASENLIDILYSCGFYNVVEYPGGVEEWFSNGTLFEDAKETEDGNDEQEDEDEDEDEEEDEEVEFLVDGITYIRKLDDSNEVLTADTHDVVGKYDGKGVVWASKKTYKAHKQKLKATSKKRDSDSESDSDSDSGPDSDSESDTSSDSEDDVTEDDVAGDDVTEDYLDSRTVSQLKQYLKDLSVITKDNQMNTKIPKSKSSLIQCIMNCKKKQRGGANPENLIYQGGTASLVFDKQFRGWGFTFR
tara:strand:- start:2978 stop:4477 length:1500 start_codon:yes stop_codon:yes gene_type:complete